MLFVQLPFMSFTQESNSNTTTTTTTTFNDNSHAPCTDNNDVAS